MDKYKKVRLITKKRFNEFQTYFRGFAPPEASDLLEKARLDWLYELTKTLDIWQTNYYTNGNLTDGELILGYANLGALVEGWMKIFYSAYILDYEADTDIKIINPKTKELYEVENLKFETLKQYSVEKLFKKSDTMYNWICIIQARRNIIHAFKDKDLGKAEDFIKNIDIYCEFVLLVNNRIPHINHRNTM